MPIIIIILYFSVKILNFSHTLPDFTSVSSEYLHLMLVDIEMV